MTYKEELRVREKKLEFLSFSILELENGVDL